MCAFAAVFVVVDFTLNNAARRVLVRGVPYVRHTRPWQEAASSCDLSPLTALTHSEGTTIVLGSFAGIGEVAMAAGAAANAIEIADGELSQKFRLGVLVR